MTFPLLRRGSSLMCMGYVWRSNVDPCLPPSLKEHLQLFTTTNTQRACSSASGETFTSAFHLTVEALGSHMWLPFLALCGFLGSKVRSSHLYGKHITHRGSSPALLSFFFFCHGIVRTHKNLNNGSLKDECKKFGVLG